MARERSPARDEAYKIYKKYKGNIDLVKIAEQLSVSPGTIRGWKNKDNWEGQINGTFQNNTERSNKKTNKKTIKKEPVADEVKQVLENAELTDKQRLFCIYYIKCFNATKAAIKAGYSQENAGKIGYQLLEKTRIKDEIQILKEGKLNRALLSEDDIYQKYIDIAFADITDYVEFKQEEVPVMGPFGPLVVKGKAITKMVNVVKFKESTSVDGTLITEVKQGKDGASIKLADKMKALQWLSDRVDLIPNLDKEKLELEKQKLELAKTKSGAYDNEEVIEDDGFINALHGAAAKVWSDEEDI